jgi:hypothetical protein
VAIAVLCGVLKRNVGGVFAIDYSMWLPLGFGTVLAGIWTLLTSEVYVLVGGKRSKVEFESSIYFIPMHIAGWILLGAGCLAMGWGYYETLVHLFTL